MSFHRTIVWSTSLNEKTQLHETIELAGDTPPGEGRIGDERQAFAGEIVHDHEHKGTADRRPACPTRSRGSSAGSLPAAAS
jgi:hypothetical protein